MLLSQEKTILLIFGFSLIVGIESAVAKVDKPSENSTDSKIYSQAKDIESSDDPFHYEPRKNAVLDKQKPANSKTELEIVTAAQNHQASVASSSPNGHHDSHQVADKTYDNDHQQIDRRHEQLRNHGLTQIAPPPSVATVAPVQHTDYAYDNGHSQPAKVVQQHDVQAPIQQFVPRNRKNLHDSAQAPQVGRRFVDYDYVDPAREVKGPRRNQYNRPQRNKVQSNYGRRQRAHKYSPRSRTYFNDPYDFSDFGGDSGASKYNPTSSGSYSGASDHNPAPTGSYSGASDHNPAPTGSYSGASNRNPAPTGSYSGSSNHNPASSGSYSGASNHNPASSGSYSGGRQGYEEPQRGCKMVVKQMNEFPDGYDGKKKDRNNGYSSKKVMMVKECFYEDDKPNRNADGSGNNNNNNNRRKKLRSSYSHNNHHHQEYHSPNQQNGGADRQEHGTPYEYDFKEDGFFSDFFGNKGHSRNNGKGSGANSNRYGGDNYGRGTNLDYTYKKYLSEDDGGLFSPFSSGSLEEQDKRIRDFVYN